MQTTDPHQQYMLQALDLARKGIGSVEPNPAVGCVIVKDDKVIGKGFHEKFGQPHAEVNAINDCKKNDHDTAGVVMYVTLEPCCHTGKTPPCTEAVIAAGIKKVFIANIDPFENVSGKGIEKLQNAGIQVYSGICAEQAAIVNAPFFKFAKTKLPWTTLKWAQSLDGYMATTDTAKRRWISNAASREDVHKLRSIVQAILVGVHTVIADDPMLTPRPDNGKHPLRIVMDSSLRIPLQCKLLNTKDSPTLIVTTLPAINENQQKLADILEKGAEIFTVDKVNIKCDIAQMLGELANRNIQQLLIEGGPTIQTAFIESGFADEVRVYTAPEKLGKDGAVKVTRKMKHLASPENLYYTETKEFDGDIRISGFIRKVNL